MKPDPMLSTSRYLGIMFRPEKEIKEVIGLIVVFYYLDLGYHNSYHTGSYFSGGIYNSISPGIQDLFMNSFLVLNGIGRLS
jgi:hypothetical protein